MSNQYNSPTKTDDESDEMARSTSAVRFQIEKVSDDDQNSQKLLCDTTILPTNFSSSSPSVSKKRVLLGDDACAHNSTISDINQTIVINNTNQETYTYDTIDTLPHIDHYRNLFSLTLSEPKTRPTLEELHGTASIPSKYKLASTIDLNGEMLSSVAIPNESPAQTEVKQKIDIVKFGWIIGVLVRCVLNIFGVMLFLRLSWVTGQAGIGLACVIVLISTVVTVVTSLSMSAICTNGEVKGGGTYYLISRSLGPEFGGAIGLIFSFVNAVAAAMYTIGFAETVRDILKEHGVKIFGTVVDGESVNVVRIIGFITMTIILGIALIGMRGETIVQIVLLVTLSASLLDFFIGSLLPTTPYKRRHGFEGYSWKVIKENFGPRFQNGETFQSVFGVFFPSVTGILAGANISGNLKNPSKAIPLGTNTAIAITTSVYLAFCIISGCTTYRDVTLDFYERRNESVIQIVNCSLHMDDRNCKSGLIYNYQTMTMISAFGPIITAGIFAATLSSALASLVSAPKIFQAVCRDMIFPRLKYFSVGNGKSDEPIRAYFLTYFVAVAFTAIGELNRIAPIISNFFLMTYALVNYACFDASLAKASGWRPAFRYFNKWLALVGALLCVGVMFIINWWAALTTFVVSSGIFLYCVGVGKIRPNVVVFGFKNDWLIKADVAIDYFNIIHDALHLKYGIGILRLQSGLDFSDFFGPDLPDDDDDDDDEADAVSFGFSPVRASKSPANNNGRRPTDVLTLKNTIINEGALLTMNIFQPKHDSSSIIDVWWLFDDGGLTLLLPYLLRRRKRWRNSQFRIFSCVPGEKGDAERQYVAMVSLLSKFRIKYTDLHVLHGLNKQPNENETQKFEQLLQAWHQNNENTTIADDSWRITDTELEVNKEKIKRGLNLHEYLVEYSSQSSLIIVTLPIPRKQSISAGLYLAYLEAISYNLPPLLFLRGNQKNVLTYYS
ncbi:unnamed protein product [Rotaria socialis]|uniref:Uncharacterized protein n=1 Tax=Rotaria socialis TaxID=392032 RepID=A0A820CBN1_9BILA|nr:unnamed protein product [Rotaria socialis]